MNATIPTRLTDTDKLYEILNMDGFGWIEHGAILELCRRRYGHGMTVHSRAASLRKKGYDVQNRVERRNGRVVSYYRLVVAS